MTAKLTFKVQAKTFDMELDTELTVADVKTLIEEQAGIPGDGMRLVYKGKICKDPDVLKALNVADGHMVHVVRAPGAKPPAAAAAATPAPAVTTPAAAPST